MFLLAACAALSFFLDQTRGNPSNQETQIGSDEVTALSSQSHLEQKVTDDKWEQVRVRAFSNNEIAQEAVIHSFKETDLQPMLFLQQGEKQLLKPF